MTMEYEISHIEPYIDWTYFYHAWGVKEGQPGAAELLGDALRLLDEWRGSVKTHALLMVAGCRGEGDDIVLDTGERIPLLRQQWARVGEPLLCLADFVHPESDKVGLFACTCHAETGGDDYTRLLRQTVADRLAEATAECMHRESGLGGIRPAVGYPSLPDQSIIFVLDRILHFDQIGVRLTENGAMMPHASVAGLVVRHPAARYFSVGTVGEDQLADYAQRRGMDEDSLRKYLKIQPLHN